MIFSGKKIQVPRTPSSLKFALYVKKKEIVAVNELLEKILQMPLTERQAWAEDNGDFVQSALDTFVDESNVLFDAISLDEELLGLSEHIIFSLREAMRKADVVFAETEQLTS